MAWTTPETFTAGQTLSAASMNAISGNLTALPRGLVKYHTLTTSFTTSGTHTTLQDTGLTVTPSFETGRSYMIAFHAHYYVPGGANRIMHTLLINGVVVDYFYTPSAAVTTVQGIDMTYRYLYNCTSTAAVVVKEQIAASTNNTSVSAYADSTRPRSLTVEDLGLTP